MPTVQLILCQYPPHTVYTLKISYPPFIKAAVASRV